MFYVLAHPVSPEVKKEIQEFDRKQAEDHTIPKGSKIEQWCLI